MNRRIRNRTSGGVGGRREQSRLLPDYWKGLQLHRSFKTLSLHEVSCIQEICAHGEARTPQ